METIDEQAARWAVRVDARELGPEEQRELNDWLDADPRHRGAYVRARAQWVDLDRLAALNGPAQPPAIRPERKSSMSRRHWLAAAGLAGVAIAGGGLAFLAGPLGQRRYTSGIGEIRRLSLEDGSILLLNTASEVTVQFNKQQRNICLIRGEALFEVAHDKTRPLFVHAKDVAVRAVGTAFAVRLEASQVDVTVTEGAVEVSVSKIPAGPGGPSSSAAEARRVAANERLIIAPSRASQIKPITPSEAERQLAWRAGMVSFDGEPLRAAVAAINRHNRRQIVIDDPVLGARPVVGVFRATDPDGFAAAAAAALKAGTIADAEVIHIAPIDTRTSN